MLNNTYLVIQRIFKQANAHSACAGPSALLASKKQQSHFNFAHPELSNDTPKSTKDPGAPAPLPCKKDQRQQRRKREVSSPVGFKEAAVDVQPRGAPDLKLQTKTIQGPCAVGSKTSDWVKNELQTVRSRGPLSSERPALLTKAAVE